MQLWKHQLQAIEKAKEIDKLALFFDTGTGKSATVINILRNLYNTERRIKRTLFFTPVSVCAQIKREFDKFSKIPQEKIGVFTQSGKKRIELFDKLSEQNPLGFISVTNYESVQMDAFLEKLIAWRPEILICDESQRLKDAMGVRSKKVFTLSKSVKNKYILSGTPILNSLLDIFGQVRILDPNVFGYSAFNFKNRYFYDANAGMPAHCHYPNWQPRPGAAEEIAQKIAPFTIQARKEECIDLPPLLNVEVPVELSLKQKKCYEEMKSEFVAEFNGNIMSAEFAMTKTLRMQQILCGFIQPDEKEDAAWIDEVPRMQALKDLLESLKGTKSIVWTTFRPTYPAIGELCAKLNIKYVYLTGDQSSKEKDESVLSFCNGDVEVLIANPAAGSVGINLIQAKNAIYYNKGYSLEHYEQSKARNFRGGSTMHDKVTHYHLVAIGTLDEVISKALLEKRHVGDAVLTWVKNNKNNS